ncbi:MAG: ribose 5-phosphate isomerase B [Deltaproteobacteria bacterium]|nr:ribose 5-phosphate isomerase B [Deltaproteobacteria bacterium]
MKKISVASDHAGYLLKNEIIGHLQRRKMQVQDHGCFSVESVDYPDFAALAARAVQEGTSDGAILICGTGIGMAIAANKFKGIRAANITDCFQAEMGRRHNNLNALCLGARVLKADQALPIVDVFLDTLFQGERHARRVNKVMAFEQGQSATP